METEEIIQKLQSTVDWWKKLQELDEAYLSTDYRYYNGKITATSDHIYDVEQIINQLTGEQE